MRVEGLVEMGFFLEATVEMLDPREIRAQAEEAVGRLAF
jgi:hypothetical protein